MHVFLVLNIYLCLSSLSKDASHATPESLGYRTLYASQLMSNPSMKEYSHLHNPRRPTGHKPLSSSLKLIRGLHIAMNFSISLTLISISNDVSTRTNPGPVRNLILNTQTYCTWIKDFPPKHKKHTAKNRHSPITSER